MHHRNFTHTSPITVVIGHIPKKTAHLKSHAGSVIPAWLLMVTELGFEPKTHSLEGCCSIQLSYSARE